MNGSERILGRIKSDCDESVRATQENARKERDRIIAEAQLQADKSAAEVAEKAKKKRLQMETSAQSRAQLETRNALLKRRRSEIDKTVTGLEEYLLGLNDNEYFDAIYRLAAQLSGKTGEVYLCKKDLDRLPSDFESKLSQAGLKATVSKTPADISGGFILKNGDVEENMEFAAIISSRRDEIEDLINQELFVR